MYISKHSSMDHTVLPANTPCLPFLRMRSPDGATSNWGKRHLIAAYYSSIDPEGMKGWVGLVGWPIADVYPHKWSPVSYMSSAGQGKYAGRRPTFYHWATQPTLLSNLSRTASTLCHQQNNQVHTKTLEERCLVDVIRLEMATVCHQISE